MVTSIQEALWVLRAQFGDREALQLLLPSVQPMLYRYLRGIVGASSADDVLEDVLVVLYRKLGVDLGTRRRCSGRARIGLPAGRHFVISGKRNTGRSKYVMNPCSRGGACTGIGPLR